MIEVLQDMPDGVSGIRVSGRVTADDFHQFKPTLHTMLDSDEIRFVEVIGPDSRTPRNGRRADRPAPWSDWCAEAGM